MSASENAKKYIDQAVQMMYERNLMLEAENRAFRENVLHYRSDAEFYKQQSEFWAAECISEQRKVHVSLVMMIIVCLLSFASIGMNILICQ